ncbi:MAG: hypothetical protein U9N77_08175 [Thermodesulfobacteriota bacterium]|nr:hypothetical protein [Thermodesulfobacteriota bacterium]
MLRNTFHHIPGTGMKKEQKLWDSGVKSWENLKSTVKRLRAYY